MKQMLFISYLLEGNIVGVQYWLAAIGIMAALVIIASGFDLHYGKLASKKKGIFKTTSYGLRKTVEKDKTYMSFYTFAVMIDCCLSFIVPFPVACVCVAVGEILIEGISVKEKMKQIGSDTQDPLEMAKAIATVYGITDAQKVLDAISEFQKKREVRDGKE